MIDTYVDRAMSAKTDNRPEFQRMIKESAKELYGLIIVWKLDRFARNRYDCTLYSVQEDAVYNYMPRKGTGPELFDPFLRLHN